MQAGEDNPVKIRFYLRSQKEVVYDLVHQNGSCVLLKNGEELQVRAFEKRINQRLALEFLRRLLTSPSPISWSKLQAGIPGAPCSHDWVCKQMAYLRHIIPGVFETQRALTGIQESEFRRSRDLVVDDSARPHSLIERNHRESTGALRDRILRSLTGENGTVTPVLHTLSLVRRPDHLLREVWGKREIGRGEIAFPSLTGRGDAEALRMLQRRCDILGISLKESVAADEFKPADMRDGSVFWIGSPFNELHKLEATLVDEKLWAHLPQCWFRGEPEAGTTVMYPGAPLIKTNVVENDDAFAIIRSVLYKRAQAGTTRLLVAAGTNTEATLWAATLLLHEDTDIESAARLTKAIGDHKSDSELQFEVLFQTYPCLKILWSSEISDFDAYVAQKGAHA